MPRIAWRTVVSAYGEERTIGEWSRSRRCFVKPTAFFGRIVSLGTTDPDPIDVEAALCFDRTTWTFYRRHGYITDWHISIPIPHEDHWDPAEAWEDLAFETPDHYTDLTVAIHALSGKERQVLHMAVQDRSVYEISRSVGLAAGTVSYYKTRIKQRLGIMTFRDRRLRHPDVTAALNEE